jgi:SET domain
MTKRGTNSTPSDPKSFFVFNSIQCIFHEGVNITSSSTMDEEDSGSSDDDDYREACLQELLGGVHFQNEWKEEIEDSEATAIKVKPGLVDPKSIQFWKSTQRVVPSTTTSTTTTSKITNEPKITSAANGSDDNDVLFQNAFACSGHCNPNHKVQRPPLNIVSLSGNRGNGLVATRFIAKGEVIYTERAAIATQLLPSNGSTADDEDTHSHHSNAVLACQQCFRSLESYTTLMQAKEAKNGSESTQLSIPFPELWPVLLLEFPIQDQTSKSMRIDRHGRVQCKQCHSFFCSKSCHQQQLDQFGSCCVKRRLLNQLPTLLRDNDDDDDDDDTLTQIQAPVVLGAVLFLQLAHYYRMHGPHSLQDHWIHRVCGTSSDLQDLELGMSIRLPNGQVQYSLRPMYEYIQNELLHLNSPEETSILSLDLLESLAAKAARNGVGLVTQSPFKPYYAGLLRKTNYGGRESEAHHRNMQQLVAALGKESMYRGMDRDIDALVAPAITALFPLTSQCNHSCQPNAQLSSQEFADAHMDVVALQDIASGEEVCISYVGRLCNRFQRRKELRGRYLFDCECERCLNEGNSQEGETN